MTLSNGRIQTVVMKVFALLVMGLLVSSCYQNVNIVQTIPEEKQIAIIDFSQFSAQGFLFTPEPLNEAYESIGQIHYKFFPTSKRIVSCMSYQPTKEEQNRGITAESTNATTQTIAFWESSEIAIQKIVEEIYHKAVSMGGDAMMNYKMTSCSDVKYVNKFEKAHRVGVVIEGFVVKRIKD